MTSHVHAFVLGPTAAMHEDADFRQRCACGAREPGRAELLAQYAAALETIILILPGGPVVNGVAMRPEDAITDLRRRFLLDADTLAALDHGRRAVSS